MPDGSATAWKWYITVMVVLWSTCVGLMGWAVVQVLASVGHTVTPADEVMLMITAACALLVSSMAAAWTVCCVVSHAAARLLWWLHHPPAEAMRERSSTSTLRKVP